MYVKRNRLHYVCILAYEPYPPTTHSFIYKTSNKGNYKPRHGQIYTYNKIYCGIE